MELDLDSQPVTPFARALNILKPGAGGSDIVKILDGRAKRTATLNWRAGRRQPPRWALQLLARKIRERALPMLSAADTLDNEKERLGLSAGALNLARWKANRKP